MLPNLPKGYRVAGIACGLKPSHKLDLSLIVSDHPATAAGVYTQNLVCAAPVTFDRSVTPAEDVRMVLINAGIANACTGERGLEDARAMADAVLDAVPPQEGFKRGQALVMSTGVIGHFLPMDTLKAGITNIVKELGTSQECIHNAVTAILTTDTHEKVASATVEINGKKATIWGMAKGAGMIGPNMATMLITVISDLAINATMAQAALKDVAERTFNCISVDGHMSTNDTLVFLANGMSDVMIGNNEQFEIFKQGLYDVCETLAREIPNDGEGAFHLVTLNVEGLKTRDDARKIAKQIAESPLVKTAIHGADPNWGRIVSAAGYAGVPFNPDNVNLWVNGFKLFENGAPAPFDAKEVSRSMADNREVEIILTFKEGSESIRFWTTDLSEEYIHINADYTT